MGVAQVRFYTGIAGVKARPPCFLVEAPGPTHVGQVAGPMAGLSLPNSTQKTGMNRKGMRVRNRRSKPRRAGRKAKTKAQSPLWFDREIGWQETKQTSFILLLVDLVQGFGALEQSFASAIRIGVVGQDDIVGIF